MMGKPLRLMIVMQVAGFKSRSAVTPVTVSPRSTSVMEG
jgi:hypothetical protein